MMYWRITHVVFNHFYMPVERNLGIDGYEPPGSLLPEGVQQALQTDPIGFTRETAKRLREARGEGPKKDERVETDA